MPPAQITRRAPTLAEDFGEPLVPIPSPKTRRWLLAALILWQVLLFWLIPLLQGTIKGLNAFGISDQLDLPSRFSYFAYSQFTWELMLGASLAASANIAFAAAKMPGHWLVRLLVATSICSAALLGVVAAFGDPYHRIPFLQIVIPSTMTFAILYLLWSLFPSIKHRRLVPCSNLERRQKIGSLQVRLSHLFYAVTIAASLAGLARVAIPTLFIDPGLHEPIDRILIALLLSAVTAAFSLTAHSLALARGRKVWLLFGGLLLVPLVSLLTTVLLSGITGSHLSKEEFIATQQTLGVAFTFLAGTGLALRLLGYRLHHTTDH